jgi:hypothetical protein
MEDSMKAFFLTLSLMTASFVQAGSIKIYEGYPTKTVQASFRFNPDLGRAWVEVDLNSNVLNDTEATGVPVIKVKVPGLSYDTNTSSIVLASEGQLINCADVKVTGSKLFRKTKITNDRCSLSYKNTTVNIDDGFEVRKARRLQVFLNVE